MWREYIHQNPVRARMVERSEDYPNHPLIARRTEKRASAAKAALKASDSWHG